jgi:hypothetical protein
MVDEAVKSWARLGNKKQGAAGSHKFSCVYRGWYATGEAKKACFEGGHSSRSEGAGVHRDVQAALAVHAAHSDMNVITVIYLLMFPMRMT